MESLFPPEDIQIRYQLDQTTMNDFEIETQTTEILAEVLRPLSFLRSIIELVESNVSESCCTMEYYFHHVNVFQKNTEKRIFKHIVRSNPHYLALSPVSVVDVVLA